MKNNDLYLIASYTAKPRNPKMTKVAGYMKDPANIVYDEKVEFSIGTKNKDINAGVMLNLTKRQVVKNKFQPDADFVMVLCRDEKHNLRAA